MINPEPDKWARLLEQPLPGETAHRRMAPTISPGHHRWPDPNGATPSGVLILLYPDPDVLTTVFIERNSAGPHGGQISLPGGKKETTDPTLIHTALRESEEEIGVIANNVRVIGMLTPLFVSHSNFSITPVVGYLSSRPEFHLNPREVTSLIRISVDQLFDVKQRRIMTIKRSGWDIEAPYYDAHGHRIWGATAMIMSEFEAIFTS